MGWSVKQGILKNRPPESWFYEREELPYPLDQVLEDFWRLDTERPMGMSPGKIPASKIEERMERRGLSRSIQPLYEYLIRQAEHAYFEWLGDQRKSHGSR